MSMNLRKIQRLLKRNYTQNIQKTNVPDQRKIPPIFPVLTSVVIIAFAYLMYQRSNTLLERMMNKDLSQKEKELDNVRQNTFEKNAKKG